MDQLLTLILLLKFVCSPGQLYRDEQIMSQTVFCNNFPCSCTCKQVDAPRWSELNWVGSAFFWIWHRKPGNLGKQNTVCRWSAFKKGQEAGSRGSHLAQATYFSTKH